MTDHPCKGMTKVQRDVFEAIAIGMGPREIRIHPRIAATLIARGLIEKGEDEIVGRDRFGPITFPTYYVPLHIHKQWCDWCSENVKDEP